MSIDKLAESAEQPLPDDAGVLLEPLLLDDVEDREADRGRHRVATERVEVLHAVRERVRDLASRDHGSERVAVADRLAHRDDVRCRALGPEGPRVDADA